MSKRSVAAFTLVELLVCIAVICILISSLMPVLGRARSMARTIKCLGNLRQLGGAWQFYADDHRGYCMPQVWFAARPYIYWWGTYANPPDYTQGFLYPYFTTSAGIDNVFDCPEQPWGSYVFKGGLRSPSTTYGYNGLYLCPFHSGWDASIGDARTQWRRIDDIESPGQVFVFADTLLDWNNQGDVSNNCLLDGPQLPARTAWAPNGFPTLCFRHRGCACVVFADTHADTVSKGRACLTSRVSNIGYVGEASSPHYVPDWRTWY